MDAIGITDLRGGGMTTGKIVLDSKTTMIAPTGYSNYWEPTWPWIYPSGNVYFTYPTYPLVCLGDVHVFGCEHATKCKCGAASRKVAAHKCGVCGK